jgi:transposase
MSLAELVILSVKVEGRSKSEVARDYKISRYWVQQLVKRYDAEGEAAFQARSRRPHSNPRSISLDLEDQIIQLRKDLRPSPSSTRAQKPSAVTSTPTASPGSRRPRRSGGC